MPIGPKDFKKLLIDLDLSQSEIGRRVGISQTAVALYFDGALRATDTRARIRSVLESRAKEKGIELPAFWEEEEAA